MIHTPEIKSNLRGKGKSINSVFIPSISEFNKEIHIENNSELPIFRLRADGKIIYANRAAFPVLKEWNCTASNRIPETIRELFPVLTQPNADENIVIMGDKEDLFFSVVGFKEAGYIGVYGFKKEED
ncbi:MAG: hypothetical protein KA444_02235 [Bacteroidia bacterium]|nr:hypothetical protein [Bacteroidia bacterium]